MLACRTPLMVQGFQLRQGEKVLHVREFSPFQELMIYYLNWTTLEDQGPLTCRYCLNRRLNIWSEDSEPIELMWSDGEFHSGAAGEWKTMIRSKQDGDPKAEPPNLSHDFPSFQ